jgi:small subunit ribosomal protein S18
MSMSKCFFCSYNTNPHYLDIDNISKFLSPRMKLLSHEKSGVCAKHQRKLTKHIKHARYLALLPYTSYQGEV